MADLAPETNSLWLTSPEQAHKGWRASLLVADRSYAEQSQRLYQSLFGRFCGWLRTQDGKAGQPVTLATLQSVDLAAFLTSLKGRADKPASPRTQRTYLAEIERVMQHLQGAGLRHDNPAQALLENARLVTPLKPRNIHLPAADMPQRFHAWLRQLALAGDAPAPLVQDVCMVLLMLECGLTHKELQKLLLSHATELATTGQITTPGHRTLMPRRIEVNEVTAKWLGHWLDLRQALRVVSRNHYAAMRDSLRANDYTWDQSAEKSLAAHKARPALFVTFAGRAAAEQKGMRGLGLAIDKLADSTVYDAAEQAVFALSEASPAELKALRHKGPQALRNLCCARMLAQGVPATEIATTLGLRRNDQVWAMARQLKLSEDHPAG
jgi:integrase